MNNQQTFFNADATTIIVTTCDNQVLLQLRDNKPSIEHPDCFSLISGYIDKDETPLEAAIRELTEELSTIDGTPLRISKITYLGSIWRSDKNRYDYIHHAYLLNDKNNVKINEGRGLSIYDYSQAISLTNIAPHHKYFLERYKEKVKDIDFSIVSKQGYRDVTINDLFSLRTLHEGKRPEVLEKEDGYYVGEGDAFTCSQTLDVDIKFMGYLRFVPGKPRGNHCHLRKVEDMLLLSGEIETELRLLRDESVKVNVLWRAGQIMRTMPGVIHTLTAQGETVATALEYSPQKFDVTDVYKMDKS